MAFTLGVGPAQNSYSGFDQTTLAVVLSGTTIGRSIIVGCYWFDNVVTLTSVSCSGESNLTIHGSPMTMASGPTSIQFASLSSNTAGGDKTITMTISGTKAMGIFAFELVQTPIYDTSNGTGGSSIDPTGSVTTSSDNELVVGLSVATVGAVTVGAGFTDVPMTDNIYSQAGEYKLDAGVAGVKSVPFVDGSSSAWLVGAAAFRESSPVSRIPLVGSLALTGVAPTATNSDTQLTPLVGSLAFTGYAPTGLIANITPLVGSAVLTGVASTVISGTIITPLVGSAGLTGVAADRSVGTFAAPSLEVLTATGLSIQSPYTVGAVILAALTATGVAIGDNSATGSVTLEQLTGLGYGLVQGSASLMSITGAGQYGNYTYGAATLECVIVHSDIASGAARLEKIQALGYGSAALLETYKTLIMNSRNNNVTEYANYNFNSYAYIGGAYYGASSSGLYLLSGADDDGSDINWSVKTGQMDDKSILLKRLPEIVVGLRSSGPIRVRVWKDDNEYFDYTLPATKTDTIHQARVNPGKGMRSRYYAVELQGIANAAAEIDSLQLNMTKTTRRIG